jgi:hypothetical protein
MDADEIRNASGRFLRSFFGIMIAFVLLGLVGLILFRTFFVDFVDNYEIGYKYDLRSGKVEVLHKTGYIVTPPFVVNVHSVDLRPMQVCINANQRVLNCKLVKFNPAGLELFISWHGRSSYDQVSLNRILMSYAYDGSGKSYPFLDVLRELKPEDSVPVQVGASGAPK